MSAFAIGHLHDVHMGPEIVAYLEGIDATLVPYGGRFRIHGASPELLEGRWSGDLVVIEFPDLARARAWYTSDAYQQILPLRMRNAAGTVMLLDGVAEPHAATDILRSTAAA